MMRQFQWLKFALLGLASLGLAAIFSLENTRSRVSAAPNPPAPNPQLLAANQATSLTGTWVAAIFDDSGEYRGQETGMRNVIALTQTGNNITGKVLDGELAGATLSGTLSGKEFQHTWTNVGQPLTGSVSADGNFIKIGSTLWARVGTPGCVDTGNPLQTLQSCEIKFSSLENFR